MSRRMLWYEGWGVSREDLLSNEEFPAFLVFLGRAGSRVVQADVA